MFHNWRNIIYLQGQGGGENMTAEELWFAGYNMSEEEHDEFERTGRLDEYSDDEWDDSDDPYDD